MVWAAVLVIRVTSRRLGGTTLSTTAVSFCPQFVQTCTMANTSSRTLRLLSLLQTHRYWPGAELADRLGVSPRTLRRDIDRLRELGYPVEAQRGVDGGYQLAAGAALPPLVLDDDEAVALAVGLLAAAQSPVEGTAESSVRALAKVVQVMPKRLRRRVDALRTAIQPMAWAGTGSVVDPDVLTTAAQACRDTVRLAFDYVAADGRRSERHVDPHRLVTVGRRWYLVAYDVDRHDWRSFRLDRMARPSPGQPFAPRRLPAADAATFVRAGLARAPQQYVVRAEVSASAGEVEARIGRWASVEPLGEHESRVTINADSLDWAMIGLVATGAPFRVLDPPEFVTYLRDINRRLTRATKVS
jgi:predicted DNA-binding transcriptional regulator YafY